MSTARPARSRRTDDPRALRALRRVEDARAIGRERDPPVADRRSRHELDGLSLIELTEPRGPACRRQTRPTPAGGRRGEIAASMAVPVVVRRSIDTRPDDPVAVGSRRFIHHAATHRRNEHEGDPASRNERATSRVAAPRRRPCRSSCDELREDRRRPRASIRIDASDPWPGRSERSARARQARDGTRVDSGAGSRSTICFSVAKAFGPRNARLPVIAS